MCSSVMAVASGSASRFLTLRFFEFSKMLFCFFSRTIFEKSFNKFTKVIIKLSGEIFWRWELTDGNRYWSWTIKRRKWSALFSYAFKLEENRLVRQGKQYRCLALFFWCSGKLQAPEKLCSQIFWNFFQIFHEKFSKIFLSSFKNFQKFHSKL